MRSSHSLDRLGTAFDDDRLAPDAGLILPATLVHHLGLKQLVDGHLDLSAKPLDRVSVGRARTSGAITGRAAGWAAHQPASHAASHGGDTAYHGVAHVDEGHDGDPRRVPQDVTVDGCHRDS